MNRRNCPGCTERYARFGAYHQLPNGQWVPCENAEKSDASDTRSDAKPVERQSDR